MAALMIADAKKADEKTKFLVFGYIKLIQKKFESESISTIPTEIIYLCILFLFEVACFEIPGDEINISQDGLKITKDPSATSEWESTSYAQPEILSTSKKIITWKIKIGECESNDNICIGIASTIDCQNKDYSYHTEGFYYTVSSGGVPFKCAKDRTAVRNYKYRCRDASYKSGDIVTMILNLQQATLSLGSSEKPKVAFKNIKIDSNVSYRLAVILRYPLDSISIVACDEQI